MQIKKKWVNNDFDNMGWHDCSIYNFTLPQEDFKLIFDIDYIFKWELNENTNLFKFYISPCILKFNDVLNLNINLSFIDEIGLSIREIRRINPRLSLNGKTTIWTFIIETDKGEISFTSTGFEQIVKSKPILSEDINLGRIIDS